MTPQIIIITPDHHKYITTPTTSSCADCDLFFECFQHNNETGQSLLRVCKHLIGEDKCFKKQGLDPSLGEKIDSLPREIEAQGHNYELFICAHLDYVAVKYTCQHGPHKGRVLFSASDTQPTREFSRRMEDCVDAILSDISTSQWVID